MKRLVTILLSSLLMINCLFSSAGRVYALENAEQIVSEDSILPREIMRGTHTSIETYAGNYKVRVILNYAYRFEASNVSKKYITGILGGSVVNYSGWISVGSYNIQVNNVTYSENQQVARVPVSYDGSIGSGNNIHVDELVTIDLT